MSMLCLASNDCGEMPSSVSHMRTLPDETVGGRCFSEVFILYIFSRV